MLSILHSSMKFNRFERWALTKAGILKQKDPSSTEGAVPSPDAIFKEMPENPKGDVKELFRRVRTDSYQKD